MVQQNDFHRKKFLQLSARMAISLAGIMGLGGLARYFGHRLESNRPRSLELGPVKDFPKNGKLILPDVPAVIYKTAAGFQAYSLICTHLGCTLEEEGENFSCPCHGSQFDSEGYLIKGPAIKRLTELQIKITEQGNLILDTGEGWQ